MLKNILSSTSISTKVAVGLLAIVGSSYAAPTFASTCEEGFICGEVLDQNNNGLPGAIVTVAVSTEARIAGKYWDFEYVTTPSTSGVLTRNFRTDSAGQWKVPLVHNNIASDFDIYRVHTAIGHLSNGYQQDRNNPNLICNTKSTEGPVQHVNPWGVYSGWVEYQGADRVHNTEVLIEKKSDKPNGKCR